MIIIKAHDGKITVIDDGSKFTEYDEGNLEDMKKLVLFLVDELGKESAKQKQWFEKYWECRKKLNIIKDTIGDE
jgi:hypothetical protein